MSPLLSIQSLSKSFGIRPLFQDISLVISEGEKVALIGPNGSGKSTLMKIISGLEHADEGEVSMRKHTRLGYVPQQDVLPSEGSVADVISSALPHDHPQKDNLVAIYLGKAGFSDRDQPVSSLSGGWKKRLAITRELVKEPDLLLLDEPTNHLDIESVLWLEEVVAESNAAVFFISHDRYFIENVAQRVVELERRYPKGFLSVAGRYSDFISARVAFLEQMQSYKDSLENRVRREVEWLRRGAKARTTKAKGRIKEANRLIDELKGIDLKDNKARLEFSSSGRRTKELIKTEQISKALSGKTLFKNLDLIFSPGSRFGIVGSNGSGKTTLIRTVLKELSPDSGTVWHAPGLRVAFFEQNRKQLNPDESLLKALCNEGDAVQFNGRELHVTSWARRFLFRSDQLQLPVRSLSGGEQARLLIARLMLQPADIIVLDEPTNDLDISTLEVLEETLCEFSGAVVLVTHDRYMLDRVSTSVIGLAPNGKSGVFADYTQFELSTAEESAAAAKEPSDNQAKVRQKTSSPKKITYAERLELEGIEAKILQAEALLEKLQSEMNEPTIAGNAALLHSHCEKLSNAQKAVDDLYSRWQELESKQKSQ